MTPPTAALELRNRAYVLQLEAAREYDEGRRRHMHDLAATYQRAADELVRADSIPG